MEPLVTEDSNNIFDQIEIIVDSLSHFRIQVNTIQQQIRQLEKNIKKEMKGLKKAAAKSKNKGNKKPSGFANPTNVTKELCEFMNKQEGTQIARTEVTRALISYIKANNLQNKANKINDYIYTSTDYGVTWRASIAIAPLAPQLSLIAATTTSLTIGWIGATGATSYTYLITSPTGSLGTIAASPGAVGSGSGSVSTI